MDIDKELTALTREFAALAQKDTCSRDIGHLSVLQLQVLTTLYFRGAPPTMSELAEDTDIFLPSASVIVDKLEEHRLVERYHRPDDRRIIQVRLTSKGAGLIERHLQTAERTLKQALGTLSDSDKKVVLRFFERYLHALRESQR